MSLVAKVMSKLRRRYYVVGYGSVKNVNISTNSTVSDIRWITYKGYKENWVADPYIFSETDSQIDFLVEEWVEKKHKGRLVKISLDKRSHNVKKNVILDLSTHLSFPSIIREDDNIYICPENAASGKQNIYRFNPTSECLESPVTIIEEPLLDVNIVKIGEAYYAFGIRMLACDSADKGDNCHLRIFKSEKLLGNYKLIQVIDNELAQERGAGALFWHKGKLIRPVQNCKDDYGRNVIFKEITIENGVFKETVLGSLLPSKRYPEGLHTFNVFGDTFVIDGMGYYVGNWMTRLKKLLHRW